MSVQIHYSGGLGNNIFQYFAARFLAEENGMKLNTLWIKDDLIPIAHDYDVNARDGDGPFQHLGDEHDILSRKWEKNNYRLNGVFQVWQWYFERKDRILNALRLPSLQQTNSTDLVAHIRLGDYIPCRAAIDIEWYIHILEQESFRRLFVVTDDPNNERLKRLSKFRPIIINKGITHDFLFIRNARRLVMSNSTFCWWAAFSGNPERILFFPRWIGNPVAKLNQFPGAIPIDGKFLHEVESN